MKIKHLHPYVCVMCEYRACFDELPFCSDCISRLQKLLSEPCVNCGKTSDLCECGKNVRTLFFYNTSDAKRLIYHIKTFADTHAVKFLAELAVKVHGLDKKNFDGIAYVPRRGYNRRKYGFDQSELLAKYISELCGVPVAYVLKNRGKKDQKLLGRADRAKNVRKRYYAIDDGRKYRRLLLIDDVTTTGATLDVCASILREGTAKQVTKLTLAKTVLKEKGAE